MSSVDYDSLSRMLTLRYDPNRKPVRKPLTPEDFVPRSATNLESEIIGIIDTDLAQKQRQLRFDKISVALSSGIDSAFVLSMVRQYLPDVKVTCISHGFGEQDSEVARAKELSQIYDSDFHCIIKEDVLSELPKVINIVREPRWNIYIYYTLEYGRKLSNVLYTGDGGDEVFGGYAFRYKKFLDNLPNNATWKQKVKLYLSCHERDWVPEQEEIFGNKIEFSWEYIYSIFKPYFENSLEPLDQVFLSDFNGKLLFDWIPANIAFSKCLDLNIESVFLTDRIINFSSHIPWNVKYDRQSERGKMPLVSILAKQKGFERYKAVKKGFGPSLTSLWKRSGHEIVKKYVNSDSEVVKNGIINGSWLEGAVRKLAQDDSFDPRYVSKVLGILALEIWYRLFVTKTMKSSEKL